MIHIAVIEIAILWYLWNRYLRVRRTDNSTNIQKPIVPKKYSEDDNEDDVFGDDIFGNEEDGLF